MGSEYLLKFCLCAQKKKLVSGGPQKKVYIYTLEMPIWLWATDMSVMYIVIL